MFYHEEATMKRLHIPAETPVSELKFKRHGHRIGPMMKSAGITKLAHFQDCTEADLLRTPNFGRASMTELKRVLADAGHTLPA